MRKIVVIDDGGGSRAAEAWLVSGVLSEVWA